MSAWRAPSLVGATLTLLTGGALAQLVPLLLGPFIARLFTPVAFGLFTQFATVAAALAVAASLRYEQALPLAFGDGEARALLALALHEICSIARADVDAHFRNAFANRFTVTEIAVLGRPDTVDDPRTPNVVLQAGEPGIEILGAQDGDQGTYCIRLDTTAQSSRRHS